MSRARSAVAVRTTVEKLRDAIAKAYEAQPTDSAEVPDFDGAVDFCQPHTELLGGAPGLDAWYVWRVKDWAIVGDLGLTLSANHDALLRLSRAVGEVVVGAVDEGFAYARFAFYKDGQCKRRLTLENDEVELEGLPVQAERGRHLVDFDIEEAERLWTSYGLPTFEYDPEGGPFHCLAVQVG